MVRCSFMRALLRQISEVCNKNPYQPKWMIVPSHAFGRMLGERLVREGINWANLRFVSVSDLALEIAGPKLASEEIGLFNDDSGPALILKLLLELPSETPTYFRALSDHLSVAAALWSAVQDLRLADVRSNDLTDAVFTNPA